MAVEGLTMPAGRPTDYSEELVDEFCRRVASGRSVLAVCADMDMPSDTTVYRWRQEKPQFRDKLTCARDDRLEAYADRLDALALRVIEEQELDPQRVNAAVNAIDKAARLQAPKQRIEVGGPNGGPIQTEERAPRDVARLIAFALAAGLKE
jgi:transposase-like protein